MAGGMAAGRHPGWLTARGRRRAQALAAVTAALGAAVVVLGTAGQRRAELATTSAGAHTFTVEAPTAAQASARSAEVWAGAQVRKALPFVQRTNELPARHEAYYTVHASNEKQAAQIAVEEYRETHPSSTALGRSGNTVVLNAKNQKQAAAKAVAMVAATSPGCTPPQECAPVPQRAPSTSVNPVQVNARLVFPPADQKLAHEQPCVPTDDPASPCRK